MPTYQYKCKKCGYELEEFQSITEPPLVHCPNCNTDNLTRIVGTGGGVIFKGNGFYQTDYKRKKSDGTKKDAAGEKAGDTHPASPAAPPKDGSGA